MSASCDNRDGNIRLILIPLPPYITTSGCSLSLVYLFRRVREQSWVGGYMVREGVCVDGHRDKVEREGRGRWKKGWSSERQKVWDRCSRSGEGKESDRCKGYLPSCPSPRLQPPELSRCELLDPAVWISPQQPLPQERRSGLCRSRSLLPGYPCCRHGGEKPRPKRARICWLVPLPWEKHSWLTVYTVPLLADLLADLLSSHVRIRKESPWEGGFKEKGEGGGWHPALHDEESCLVAGILLWQNWSNCNKSRKGLVGAKSRLGLAELLKQEGCGQLCRSSLLVQSPKPPASSSVRDVYWPPKWKSTGTYLLSQT